MGYSSIAIDAGRQGIVESMAATRWGDDEVDSCQKSGPILEDRLAQLRSIILTSLAKKGDLRIYEIKTTTVGYLLVSRWTPDCSQLALAQGFSDRKRIEDKNGSGKELAFRRE